MKKSVLTFFALILCSLQFAFANPATLTKENARMFWRIDGTDKNGNPSVVYIQGTIHIGDERLYPLSDEVLDAWAKSDRLVGEIASRDMDRLQTVIQRDMFASYRRAEGRNLFDYLTDDEKDLLYTVIDGNQLETFASFEPWVLNSVISSFGTSDSGFETAAGIDQTFLDMAKQEERLVEGLDTLRTQLNILEFGDYDQQLYLLKQSIAELNADEGESEIENLYEAYLADDVELAAQIVFDDMKLEEEDPDFALEYVNAIYSERNHDWAIKIANWLSEGGTTFIFAGAGHFIGDESVFVMLKENGVID